jgi:hypothetical protein
MPLSSYSLHYEGPDGGMLIYWTMYRNDVAKFIEANDIKAVQTEYQHMLQPEGTHSKSTNAEKIVIRPAPIPGGIRVPHLHCSGKLYLLTRKQWNDFSGQAVSAFKEKLAKANTVESPPSFDQLMDLSEAVHAIV